MKQDFVADWAFGITGAIENSVRRVFPQELRRWPLLQAFVAEAYELPEQHMVIVLRDRLSGMPVVGGPEPFPYSDHPTLPPKVEEIELWQFYLRDKFGLREEDAALVIPIKDSGQHGAAADYELFSAQERMFWNHQVGHVIAGQAAHLQIIEGPNPQQPSNVTYEVSGTNARVNINSTDSSINEVRAEVPQVFDQLRAALANIDNGQEREAISKSIDDMESSHGSPDFLTRYKTFVSVAADHATVFAPFLPALANLLN
ncbi:MAG: hypothetical protein WKF53_17610 [Rubrobacter sp.]